MGSTKPWWEHLIDLLAGMLAKQELRDAGATPAQIQNAVVISKPLGSMYDRQAEEDHQRAAVVKFLEDNVGDPYTFGAEIDPTDPDPVTGDCSEYMEQAYIRAGLSYPDGARYQLAHCRGRRVHEPKPGDPFFFGPNKDGIPHTGAYVGDGMAIHAQGRPVRKVVKVARSEIEMHPRFQGWYRHPEFSFPIEERA